MGDKVGWRMRWKARRLISTNEGVEIGDGLLVTEFRAFDAEVFSLGIDAFTGGPLIVK